MLWLCCDNLYESGRLETSTILVGNRKTDTIGEQNSQVGGASELSDPFLKEVALNGLSVCYYENWLKRYQDMLSPPP